MSRAATSKKNPAPSKKSKASRPAIQSKVKSAPPPAPPAPTHQIRPKGKAPAVSAPVAAAALEVVAPPPSPRNVNVLEGMACPGCGSSGPFRIRAVADFLVYDDGLDDYDEASWKTGSRAACVACGIVATVLGFMGAGPVLVKVPGSEFVAPAPSLLPGQFSLTVGVLRRALAITKSLDSNGSKSFVFNAMLLLDHTNIIATNLATWVEIRHHAVGTVPPFVMARSDIELIAAVGKVSEVVTFTPAAAPAGTPSEVFKKFSIVSAGVTRVVSWLDPAEWPVRGDFDVTSATRLDDALLGDTLPRIAGAMSRDQTRYNLMGVMVEQAPDGTVAMVASDGHWIAARQYGRSAAPSAPFTTEAIIECGGVDVACAAIQAIKSAAVVLLIPPPVAGTDAKTGNPTVRLAKTCRIEVGPDVVVFANLIAAKFPNYNAVIPQATGYGWSTVPTVELLERLKVLGAVSAKDENASATTRRNWMLRFDIRDDALVLSASKSNGDVATAQVPRLASNGATAVSFGLNGILVARAIAALGSPATLEIGIKDPKSPALLRAPGDPDAGRAVVMPWRI